MISNLYRPHDRSDICSFCRSQTMQIKFQMSMPTLHLQCLQFHMMFAMLPGAEPVSELEIVARANPQSEM